MITPSKYLPPGRDLVSVGAVILDELQRPRTVSELWERVRRRNSAAHLDTAFDWFLTALTFAFAIGAVELRKGILHRSEAARKEV